MNSFDNYLDNQKEKFNLIDNYPFNYKKSLEFYSERNNTSNFLSTSGINNQSSILFPNKSTTNKHNKNLYSGNPAEIFDISKKNLEYDIQLTALKKKLSTIKEQRKKSEMKVNLMKLRINKLQDEEKKSQKELEDIKKSIQKIKNNRKKIENNNKTFSKKGNKKHNFIKNKTLSFINDKDKNSSYINNSNYNDKYNHIVYHNSFHISMKKNKNINNNFHNNFTPKPKYLSNKKGLNNSINRSNISNDNYGAYSFRNTSIKLDKLNINSNNSKNNSVINKNRVIPNPSNVNKSKIDLKTQIKQNLENKLKQDEEERKKIQEEIRKIEKHQYDLWMNFSENMNSGNTTFNSNINSHFRESELYNKDEDDENIVNYNFI